MSKKTAHYKNYYILGTKNCRRYFPTVLNDSSSVIAAVSNATGRMMFDIAIEGARSSVFLAKCKNMTLKTDED